LLRASLLLVNALPALLRPRACVGIVASIEVRLLAQKTRIVGHPMLVERT
jgi:hypothetical protein